MRSSPLSPSTMMAMASLMVSPTRAIGETGRGPVASALTHSAPARVFPEPRPPREPGHPITGRRDCSALTHSGQSKSSAPHGLVIERCELGFGVRLP